MAKVKVVLNRSAVREMLKSPEMEDICRDRASAAIQSLGDGYTVNTFQGKNRVNAEIAAESFQARKENMENNTILKALMS